MISEVIEYIKKRKIVSRAQLSLHFGVSESFIDYIMNFLKSGKIIVEVGSGCSTCSSGCSQSVDGNYYQLIEPKVIEISALQRNKI